MFEKHHSVKAHVLMHTWRVTAKGKNPPSRYQALNGTGAKEKSGNWLLALGCVGNYSHRSVNQGKQRPALFVTSSQSLSCYSNMHTSRWLTVQPSHMKSPTDRKNSRFFSIIFITVYFSGCFYFEYIFQLSIFSFMLQLCTDYKNINAQISHPCFLNKSSISDYIRILQCLSKCTSPSHNGWYLKNT